MQALPNGETIRQIAIVVRDLDQAMAAWSHLGIGPWQIYDDFGPRMVKGMTFRGQAQTDGVKLALCGVGPLSFELIAPGPAPSVYREHLDRHGEGLHHLGYFIDDVRAAIADMERRGYALLQTGHGFGADGDGAYAYFDTERELGCVLEAIQAPKQLPPPDRWFPKPPGG
jgi:methylmalonyl-CoA/ethylmalonyl-CoA epimerase